MNIFDQQSLLGQMLGIFLILLLFLLYPKYLLYKIINEMEMLARMVEDYVRKSVDITCKLCVEKGGGNVLKRRKIEDFLDFFIIPPVDLDPYGILKKIEHLLDKAEDRFEYIAKDIAPKASEELRANIVALLKGSIGLNMIAKLLRHYIGLIRKTNNIQLAMILHMNLPMIRRIANAQMRGIEAIAENKPIGDSIGPLIAAHLIKTCNYTEIAKDVICAEVEMEGKKVYVLKAKGKGATLGKLGDAVKKLCDEKSIGKIITIDAGLKLEGEKSGKVSEGIGAAIGDPGPEKAKIEESALKRDIPLEAYIIKMSIEEAISPLTEDIVKNSLKKTIELIRDSVRRTEGNEVIVVGVGNTSGVGNCYEEVKDLKFEKKKKEKKKGFLFFGKDSKE